MIQHDIPGASRLEVLRLTRCLRLTMRYRAYTTVRGALQAFLGSRRTSLQLQLLLGHMGDGQPHLPDLYQRGLARCQGVRGWFDTQEGICQHTIALALIAN